MAFGVLIVRVVVVPMMFLLLMLMVEICLIVGSLSEQRSRHFSVEFLLVKNCPLHENKYDSVVNNKDKSESVDNHIEA